MVGSLCACESSSLCLCVDASRSQTVALFPVKHTKGLEEKDKLWALADKGRPGRAPSAAM